MATPSMFGPVGQPASVNFFNQAPETAADLNQLQRQRAMAQLLSQQGSTPLQGQMVGGHFVAPSKGAYLAQLASAMAGGYANRQADEKERAYADSITKQRAADAQTFMQAANGTPATSREVAGPAAEGQAAPTQTTAAVPGDMNKALAIALQSQNPMLQGMAPELMKRQMDAAELNQALNAAGLRPVGGGGPVPLGSGAMASGGASNPAGANAGPAGGESGAGSALPTPPSAGPSGGPVVAGVDPRAMALTLSRNAQAQKLGTMIQEANKPMALGEAGTLVRYDANGNPYAALTMPKTEAGINVAPIAGQPGQFRAAPVQGYAEAKANAAGQVAGAEAAARDPYAALVRVDTPSGPKMMTPAQARDAAGQQSQPPVRQGGPGVRGGFTGTAEEIMASIDAAPVSQAVKQEMRQAYANQVTGNNPAYNDMGTGALPPQGGMASGGASNPAGAATGGPTQAGAGRGGQGGPGIPLQTEESQAYATARAKSYAEQAPKYQQAGQDASSTLRNLSTLETLYKDPNVAKGALAENISGLKNIGASFGIDMKGLSSEQAAEAITNKMALASRSTADGGGMPGAMSDADRKFLANMQPGLTKTPEGRAQIIDASRKVAQRQIDVANLARNYEQMNGQLDIGFDRALADYAAKNQMFTQSTPGGGSKTNLNDLLKKYR